MTTTTNDVAMSETGIDPEAGSQTADVSEPTGSASEGDTSHGGDEKYVPMSRFKEVIDQRNGERSEFKKLRQEHDQLLSWVHHEVVPAIDAIKSAGDASRENSAQEDVYVDPVEAETKALRAELNALKKQAAKNESDTFSRNLTKTIEALCQKYELASSAEIVDAYLKSGQSASFDYDAAAKRSHERYLRRFDSFGKKSQAAAKAKKLNDSSPAQMASKNPPKNMEEARKMLRAHFRNQ